MLVIMLIDRLADKPSSVLRAVRDKYVNKNPMTMEEIIDSFESFAKYLEMREQKNLERELQNES